MKKKFVYKWDRLTKIWSFFVVLLSLFLLWTCFPVAQTGAWFWIIYSLIVGGSVLFCTIFLPLYYSPLSVEKDGNTLQINYLIRKKVFDITDCRVERVRGGVKLMEYSSVFNSSLNISGFGYWGMYRNSEGKFRFSLTDRKRNLCIITLKDRDYKLIINAPYEWFVA